MLTNTLEVDGIDQLKDGKAQQDTGQQGDVGACLRPEATQSVLHTRDDLVAAEQEDGHTGHQNCQKQIIGAADYFFHKFFFLLSTAFVMRRSQKQFYSIRTAPAGGSYRKVSAIIGAPYQNTGIIQLRFHRLILKDRVRQ